MASNHSSATLDSISQMTEKLAAVHSTLAELYTDDSEDNSYPTSIVENPHHSNSMMNVNYNNLQTQVAVPAVPADSLQAMCHRLQCTIARIQEMYPVRNTRQINCVFFGRMGNGKSSLINSVYQTLTESRDSLCEVGLGDTSKTLRYGCCTELYRRDVLPLVLFDTKGLGDSSDKKTASVVRNILRGRFKAEKPMNRPKWYDYSMVSDARLKIDVVVFVYAYGTPFPYQLANTVCKEAQARGLRVIPVITHFDLVKTAEDFRDDVEKCKMTFNTQPVSLANLGALQPNPVTATNQQLWQAEHWQARSKETILDMVSQILLSGQQHHMSKKYDVHQELRKGGECTIM